jgi:hypothetical protein
MQLLRPKPESELPREALLARLRSRRARLDTTGSAAGGELKLPSELAWVHARLDRRSRSKLTPYLEGLAMRELLLTLRYRLVKEPLPQGSTTEPLLNPALVTLLQDDTDPALLTAVLEQHLVGDYPFAAGLQRCHLDQGPGGVEQKLGSGILQHGLARASAPVIAMTLRYQIDMRNLLAVLKHWRWQLKSAPSLLTGGDLDPERLTRVWHNRDLVFMGRMVGQLAGTPPPEIEPRSIERVLLDGLSRRLRRSGRDPLGLGVIIDYLWRCRVALCNRSLHRGRHGYNDALLLEALLT